MRTIAISGSASGIGAATRAHLESDGCRVVGVDVAGAEVNADLSTVEGRAAAVRGVSALCDGKLDGLVACAGLGPHIDDAAAIVSVNYFGAVALLGGLQPALAHGAVAAAVAVSSNSATIPGMDGPLVDACLENDEDKARALASTLFGQQVYAGSKLALARWVRRQATQQAWAGSAIRLNAVAPGAVQTPLLQRGLDDPRYGDAIRGFPIPLGSFGKPEQIAAAIGFLLGPEGAFCCGTVLYVDGGSDAMLRPDTF